MWYRYYAGFSSEFVSDVVRELKLGPATRVVDPWMGSGTTLAVAAANGALVAGVDLNPAMAVIAKGRLIAVDTEASVLPIAEQIARHWAEESSVTTDDHLTAWFDAASAARIRGLTRRIDEVLVDPASSVGSKAASLSSIAAFYYVATFRTVVAMLRSYSSRNPTWVKKSRPGDGVIHVTATALTEQFLESVRQLAAFIRYRKAIPAEVRDKCEVVVGDSRRQPFDDDTFDAAISSPPYLTRLDYVVGHLPELAVLGLTASQVESLRSAMIGTPTIGSHDFGADVGPVAKGIVDRVAKHGSYAASSYYSKNVSQYFQGMADSIAELTRILKSGGHAVIVVQDSRFKDLHLDLAGAVADQAALFGWSQVARKDFINLRSMSSINTRAHNTTRATKPVESVLLLQAG